MIGVPCARSIRPTIVPDRSDAADEGIITANPALQLGRRKASRADKLTPAERLQKVRPMSWEQRDAFLEAAKRTRRYYPLFATLAKTGLRPGEAFALQPGDLDVRGRTLRIKRALNLGRIKAVLCAVRAEPHVEPGQIWAMEEFRAQLARHPSLWRTTSVPGPDAGERFNIKKGSEPDLWVRLHRLEF